MVTSVFGVVLAIAAIVYILFTMPIGRRVAERLRFPAASSAPAGRAPKEDREYLLRVCGGDAAEVERRLAAEKERFPELNERAIYRRAIRTYMKNKSPTDRA